MESKWTNAETQLLISVRLKFEKEKKSILWSKVMQEIKEINPKYSHSRHQTQKKFDNLKTTYKRIQLRNHLAGRIVTCWDYFDEFDEVYGIESYEKSDSRIEILAKAKEIAASMKAQNKAENEIYGTQDLIESDINLEITASPSSKKQYNTEDLSEFLKNQTIREEHRHRKLILIKERKIKLLEQKLKNEKKFKW